MSGWSHMPPLVIEPPAPLTDEQRHQLLELVEQNPDRGHIPLARQLGVTGTKHQIRTLLAADPQWQADLREANLGVLNRAGLTVPHLFDKLAHVVDDDGNSSQFRAVQFGLALHGVRVDERVEVDHGGMVGVEVTHDRRLTLADVQEFSGRLTGLGSSTRGELPAAGPLLPEPDEDQPAAGDLPARPQ